MFKFLLSLSTLIVSTCICASTYAATDKFDYAVLLQYHHVDDSTPPITSVSKETLAEHLELVKNEGFQVLPLPEVIDTLKSGGYFKKPTAVITFDDAYDSIYTNGFPLLKKYNWPFTIFIAPKPVEERFGGTLSWDQIKTMQDYGATMVNHSYQHDYLVRRLEGESKAQWLDRIKNDTEKAQRILEEKLGPLPKYMAYPFGEFDEDIKQLMSDMGYIAFGQQSGPINSSSDFLALPRFPASGIYANVKTLKTKLSSEPFELIEQRPNADVLQTGDSVPVFTLKVKDGDFRKHQVQCFYSGEPVETNVTTEQDTVTITATAGGKLSEGRSRYNCTAPHTSGSHYFWHSITFVTQS